MLNSLSLVLAAIGVGLAMGGMEVAGNLGMILIIMGVFMLGFGISGVIYR
jgi:hypothetical protein